MNTPDPRSVPRPAPRRSPQLSRIARLLHLEQDQLQGLDDLPDADLRVLHDQISHTLFSPGQTQFAKVAALSKTLPAPAAAKLAEKFLPPVLGARVAELLDPARARDLVGRLSIRYLADIALALDPVKSRPVLEAIPPVKIREVAQALFARDEHAAMAEFASAVTYEGLWEALGDARPRDLLLLAPLLEWNERLERVVAELPETKIREIATELSTADLATLALDLEPARFAPVVPHLDVAVLRAIAAQLFAWDEHAAAAAFTAVVPAPVVLGVLDVATADDLRALAPHLQPSPALTEAAAALPDDVRAVLAEVAATADLHPEVAALL
ncbi:hypothetical protein [Nocardioides sp.]|uniref:hypothetical protein n=1 Tax=Nocardioides sp. TaxID=35761 RepID=UPI0035139E2F